MKAQWAALITLVVAIVVAIAIPIDTLSQTRGRPAHTLGQMVGRQTPFLALIVPFVLVLLTDGRRGLREAWPAALTAGFVFAIVQFAVSNYVSIQLTDILASLASAGAVLALVQVWHPFAPGAPVTSLGERPAGPAIAGGAAGDVALE